MTRPRFGDRVRIATTPETEASGFAGRVGEVWGESVPSVSDVGPVIGDRGAARAVSVFFEDSEDPAWFAPHLVLSLDRGWSRSRLVPLVFLAALALTAATAVAGLGRSPVRRLTVVSAATPCFPAHGYLTSGTYPNILESSKVAARANIALRRAVLSNERSFVRSAREHIVPSEAGIYRTAIDRRLISASTVVVSALIPALERYPGGNSGQTWISATIDVRSGRAVSLRQLLANPQVALPALARDWKDRSRRTTHYRGFALTPDGLAFGFLQESGSRLVAVIPYRLVRPYLSRLGRRLVAGVRRPRPVRSPAQAAFAWAGPHHSPHDVASGWPVACT